MSSNENRLGMRKRSLLPAKIQFNKGQSVFDCTVRDISSGGARLSMPSTLGVPYQFTLEVPAYNLNNPCRIIWCDDKEIGVSFALEKPDGQPDLKIIS